MSTVTDATVWCFDADIGSFAGNRFFVRNISEQSIVKKHDLSLLQGGKKYTVREVGICEPKPTSVDALLPGQIGYFIASCLQPSTLLGKTLTTSKEKLNEYRHIKPFDPSVYASFYPDNPKNYKRIEKAVDNLVLNDPVVTVEHAGSPTYGSGFKLGFLGSLHMEVFSQRLK